MKRFVIGIVLTLVLSIGLCSCVPSNIEERSQVYTIYATCVRVNHSDGVAYLEDDNGEVWGIFDGEGVWEEGYIGKVIIDNMGTDDIKDDIIEEVRIVGIVMPTPNK